MRNFVVRDAIVPALSATDREGAIRELVASMHRAGYFQPTDLDKIVAEVLRRETLGSTGIGRNIAIPHSRFAGVDRLIGTVGLSKPGIEYQSIDGEPVHIFVLLVSPPDRPADHLRALESVVRITRDDAFVQAMRQATTREEIWRLINEMHPNWDRPGPA